MKQHHGSQGLFLLGMAALTASMIPACGGGGGSASANSPAPANSITAGPGLVATPTNPITDTGTLSVDFAGTGSASTVARSDHHHDGRYLSVAGGTLSGTLNFAGNQATNIRVHNAPTAPPTLGAGQLWFDTSTNELKVYNGTSWLSPNPISPHRIHASTVGGAVVIPPSQTDFVVREIIFTPSNPNDIILRIEVEGSYTASSAQNDFSSDALGWEILDSENRVIFRDINEVAFMNVGTNVSFKDSGPSLLGPSPSYKIRLTARTGSSWSGQVNSTLFKILTAEGVTVSSPSPNISG